MYWFFYIVSEIIDILQGRYYESLLGYDNVEWFVDQVINLQNKMTFFFKNTKEDIILSEKDEEHCRNRNVCWFCEENFFFLRRLEILVS